ncbi:MAG: hypothetical protein M3436_16430 [Pseudomonadota bacterium]|nr:hypothetical protein [Pseudomonadota bacterium]
MRSTVQTPWDLNSQLLVRHVVSIPAGASNVRILASFDNDLVGAFFNGIQLNTETIIHANCPIRDEFRFDVPQEFVQPGENLVVFHVLDVGRESFFDARILLELRREELATTIDAVAENRAQRGSARADK